MDEIGVDVVRTTLAPFSASEIPNDASLTSSGDIYWAIPGAASPDDCGYGPFADRGDGFHLFPAGGNVELVEIEKQSNPACPGSHLNAFVCWKNPFGETTNLDLYLLRWTGFAWDPVAESARTQPEESSGFCLEYLSSDVPVEAKRYGFALRGHPAPNDLCFTILTSEDNAAADGASWPTPSQKAGMAALILSARPGISAAEIQSFLAAGQQDPNSLAEVLSENEATIFRTRAGETGCIEFSSTFGLTYCNGDPDFWVDHDEWGWTADRALSAKSLEVECKVVEAGTNIRVLVNGSEVVSWYAEVGEVHRVEDIELEIAQGDTVVFGHGNAPDGCVIVGDESPVRVVFCDSQIPTTGSLQVTIGPQGAIDAGAKWQVDGGQWLNSGETASELAEGNHTISYSTVAGWNKPADASVSVVAGETATASGTYTRQIGSLRVTISPQEAVDAGAKWRVDGGEWRNSGATATELIVGSHTVSYSTVTGWDTPANHYVTVYYNQTATDSGTYIQQTGALKVTISPQDAIDAGAKWRVDGGEWRNSGDTAEELTAENHTISFKAVMGWVPPSSRSAAINDGETTSTEGIYVSEGPLTGNKKLTQGASGNVGIGASYPGEKLVLSEGNFLQDSVEIKHKAALFDDETMALNGAFDIQIYGKYAFVVSYIDNGVEILDIANPTNPTHVGCITDDATTILLRPYGICVSGKYAYVASNGDDGVEILDISNPSNPFHVGSITDDETTALDGAWSIHVSGKYAYVASCLDDGVEILDVSEPSNPIHVGAITDDATTELDGACSIHVAGKYAYVASQEDDGVEILDVSNPAAPIHVGAITDNDTTALEGAYDIYVVGIYAYVTSPLEHGVEILDISNPSNPSHVGSITDNATTELTGAERIHVSGKYAYVTAFGDWGVEVIDISNPSNPTHVDAISDDETTALAHPMGIFVSGKYAYVTSLISGGGIEILDISGIDSPAASIGSIASDSLDVAGDAQVVNNLSAGGALNAGLGGIKSDGPMSAEGDLAIGGNFDVQNAASFGGTLNAQGGFSMNDILKLTPRESPPVAQQNGCLYYDKTGQAAFCVYLEDFWVKIAGSGSCQ